MNDCDSICSFRLHQQFGHAFSFTNRLTRSLAIFINDNQVSELFLNGDLNNLFDFKLRASFDKGRIREDANEFIRKLIEALLHPID
jgi:hypothetical protein